MAVQKRMDWEDREIAIITESQFAKELLKALGMFPICQPWQRRDLIEHCHRARANGGKVDVILCLYANGRGMRFRVPHNSIKGAMVEGTGNFGEHRPSVPVPPEIAVELLDLANRGHLVKMSEKRTGARMGWREAGYDGDVADWYLATQ